jgi:ankyrin repeat protein
VISKNQFRVADLLMKYGASIHYPVTYQNETVEIIDYFYSEKKLNDKILNYILAAGYNIGKDMTALIYKFILKKNSFSIFNHDWHQKLKNNCDLLQTIFEHYIYDNAFILRLLSLYTHKIPLSSSQLQKVISNEKNKIQIEEGMYELAVKSSHSDAITVLLNYDGSSVDELAERIQKYHLLEMTVDTGSYCYIDNLYPTVQKIMSYPFDYQSLNIRKILKKLIKNEDERVVKLVMEALLKNHVLNFNVIDVEKILIEAANFNLNVLKYLVEILQQQSSFSFSFSSSSSPSPSSTTSFLPKQTTNLSSLSSSSSSSSSSLPPPLPPPSSSSPLSFFNFKQVNLEKVLFQISYQSHYKKFYKVEAAEFLLSIMLNIPSLDDVVMINTSLLKTCDSSYLLLLLCTAIKINHIKLVKFLLENDDLKSKLNINEKYNNDECPLLIAFFLDHLEIFNYLLDHGAECYIRDRRRYLLFPLAVHYKKYKMVKSMVKTSSFINSVEAEIFQSKDLIFKAIKEGDLSTLKLLLINKNQNDKKLSLLRSTNNQNNKRRKLDSSLPYTSAQYAYLIGQKEILKFLVEYGDVNEVNFYLTTLLHFALYREDLETVEYLINHGADIAFNIEGYQTILKDSALDISLYLGNKELFYLLINNKHIKLDQLDDQCQNPLAVLIQSKDFTLEEKEIIIKDLLKKGLNIDYTNNEQTPLMYSLQENFLPLSKILIENGANVNITESNESPLLKAVKLGSLPLVKLLLEHGTSGKNNFKNNENDKNSDRENINEFNRNSSNNLMDSFSRETEEYNQNIENFNNNSNSNHNNDSNHNNNIDNNNNNNNFNYNSSFLMAYNLGEVEIIKYFLENQYKIDFFDHRFCQSLFDIMENGSMQSFKCFAHYNIDFFSCDMVNIIMNKWKRIDMLKVLIENHLNVNRKDNLGNTLLANAIITDNMYMVKYLIHHGADVDSVNDQNESIQEINVKYNFKYNRGVFNIIKSLIDHHHHHHQ